MADEIGTKVSQLPLGENLADDDLMYAVENGVSKKVEVSYLQNRIVGDVDSTPTASSDNLVTSGGVYNMIHTLDFNVFHDLTQISNSIADAFSASESYSEGDYVVYDYSLYKFTADKSAGAWDSSKATPVAVVDELGGGGTTVVPNPSGEATDTLEKLQIDQTIYDFATSNVYGEASGAIASFSDGSNNPLVKLEADINPIQDLHGYDKPWVGGAGKNKFQTTLTTTTVSGVTFTVNNDGTITTSGTPSANISTVIFGEITLPAGSYKANGNAVGSASSIRMIVYNVTDSSLIGSVYDGNEVSFTLPEPKLIRLYPIILQEYGSVNGIVFKPMIRLAAETDATFAPYTNICPISGRSSVEVTVADDTTDPTTEKTYEISLGNTYYGGKLNVTTGELTVDRALVDMGDLTWSYTNGRFYNKRDDIVTYGQGEVADILCDTYATDKYTSQPDSTIASWNGYIYVRDDSYSGNPTTFKQAMDGHECVYKLATPTTVTLTPTQVSSLLGSNNIWADSGDSDVVYIRDLNLFLTQLDARVKALENA